MCVHGIAKISEGPLLSNVSACLAADLSLKSPQLFTSSKIKVANRST
jgi:hypothetical protein